MPPNSDDVERPGPHILSIDMEDWYHANLLDALVDRDTAQPRIEITMRKMLDLLDEAGAKATVFVLGRVAERHPKLVAMVVNSGHEIASHGYDHRLIYEQSEDVFGKDIEKSIVSIQNATGVRPLGYRAPSWSITGRTLWALDIVRQAGFIYDSSIFPFRTPLYGIGKAPREPFQIKLKSGSLMEFPPGLVTSMGLSLPFSGGCYFRLLPYALSQLCFKRFARRGVPAVFYSHPWELDRLCPRVKGLGILGSVVQYGGVSSYENKLKRFLRSFRFTTFRAYMEDISLKAALPEILPADLQ
jgi:polysaccharide deacetylase family protein (PEP-CTERM system associated)